MDNFLASGSDHFQILLDHQMKVHGSDSRNVGRILFKLAPDPQLANRIEAQLAQELPRELYQLAYHRKWLTGPPTWKVQTGLESPQLIKEDRASENFINKLPLPHFDPAHGGLYQAYLFDSNGETYFMLAWHHVLFDARGAEHFARFLCGETETLSHEDCFSPFTKQPTLAALEDAKTTKGYLLSDRGMVVDSLALRSQAKPAKINYDYLTFSEEETNQILKTAGQYVRLAKSPYFLACCTLSAYNILEERYWAKGKKFSSFLIPVPQDQRLRGSVKPVFGNTLSYLFFRIKPEHLPKLKSIADTISKQMMEQIRQKIPMKYSSMLNLFSRLPLWLNNKIMSGPTKGVVASFFFSDTGDSFSNMDAAAPTQILEVSHLPPPNKYPGLTLVFSIFKKKLKVCICSTDKVMKEEEYTVFKNRLSNLLQNGEAKDL